MVLKKNMAKAKKTPKKTVLRMMVPKLNEQGPMAFEQILASLHGLLSKDVKQQADESISFEITCIRGKVYFYAVVPSHLRTLVSSQFYAQYPNVELDEVKDYFTKSLVKDKKAIIATIVPTAPRLYPIKRHPQFYNNAGVFQDPMGPITAALSHLFSRNDTSVLQFVIKPVDTGWNSAAQQGLKMFNRSGIWEYGWFQAWYEKYNLGYTHKERKKHFARRMGIALLSKWGRSEEKDVEEDTAMSKSDKTSQRHDQETPYVAAYDKLARLHFVTNIRMLYLHSDPDELHAEAKIREIMGTFQQFALPQMNSFGIRNIVRSLNSIEFKDILLRRHNDPFGLSQEELATVFHLPTETVQSPGIQWVESQKLEPPVDLPTEEEEGVTLMGETNFRTQKHKYGIRRSDRRRHVYVIGKTGMGKSTIMENMIFSDIMSGRGVGIIDPHGDLAEAVLKFLPKHRTNDLLIFDPSDAEFPIAFNMLEGKNKAQRGLIASGLIGVIKKLNIDSWGPRLEHFLRNTILALVEAPDTTMLGITRMLVDNAYRRKILHFVEDPMVQSFWATEFEALDPRKRAEAIGPIQNKVGQFLASPMIRNIVGQPKSTLDIRFAMDTGKIVVVNLSKGKIGEDNSSMLGSLLITKFQIDAMSRANIPEKERRDFYLYVDEFQNFATDSFATILSEARKYRLNLTMANQYVAQMSEDVAAAVFGNVGSLVSFQVGISDAQVFAEQFDEDRILPISLASLPKYTIYNRIMVDGLTTPVFSAKTLPPPELTSDESPEVRMEKAIRFSRQRYAKPREEVENKINRWARPEGDKRKKNGKEEGDKKPAKTAPAKKPAEKMQVPLPTKQAVTAKPGTAPVPAVPQKTVPAQVPVKKAAPGTVTVPMEPVAQKPTPVPPTIVNKIAPAVQKKAVQPSVPVNRTEQKEHPKAPARTAPMAPQQTPARAAPRMTGNATRPPVAQTKPVTKNVQTTVVRKTAASVPQKAPMRAEPQNARSVTRAPAARPAQIRTTPATKRATTAKNTARPTTVAPVKPATQPIARPRVTPQPQRPELPRPPRVAPTEHQPGEPQRAVRPKRTRDTPRPVRTRRTAETPTTQSPPSPLPVKPPAVRPPTKKTMEQRPQTPIVPQNENKPEQ
jgi:hypothetical protein